MSSSSGGAPGEPIAGGLSCPGCARAHPREERFCSSCGMPLTEPGTPVADAPESEEHEWARKIRPDYARGELVRVAGGRNQAEAELIRNMLLEEGVPSLLRRSAGFDVPDFLAAGPRDVLVPESGVEAARTTLVEAELLEPAVAAGEHAGTSTRQTVLVLAGILLAGGLTGLAAWLVVQAGG